MTSKTRRQNKQDPKFSEQDLEKTLRQNRSRTRSNKGTTAHSKNEEFFSNDENSSSEENVTVEYKKKAHPSKVSKKKALILFKGKKGKVQARAKPTQKTLKHLINNKKQRKDENDNYENDSKKSMKKHEIETSIDKSGKKFKELKDAEKHGQKDPKQQQLESPVEKPEKKSKDWKQKKIDPNLINKDKVEEKSKNVPDFPKGEKEEIRTDCSRLCCVEIIRNPDLDDSLSNLLKRLIELSQVRKDLEVEEYALDEVNDTLWVKLLNQPYKNVWKGSTNEDSFNVTPWRVPARSLKNVLKKDSTLRLKPVILPNTKKQQIVASTITNKQVKTYLCKLLKLGFGYQDLSKKAFEEDNDVYMQALFAEEKNDLLAWEESIKEIETQEVRKKKNEKCLQLLNENGKRMKIFENEEECLKKFCAEIKFD